MRDVREFFAGNAEAVGQIVIAGGNDEFAGGVDIRLGRRFIENITAARECPERIVGPRMHAEVAVRAFDAGDQFAQVQVELVVLDALAVILQRFRASGLFGGADEGQIADFQQLGRGEENHVHGIVVQRIAQHAFIDDQRAQPRAFDFDGAGEAGGPAPMQMTS